MSTLPEIAKKQIRHYNQIYRTYSTREESLVDPRRDITGPCNNYLCQLIPTSYSSSQSSCRSCHWEEDEHREPLFSLIHAGISLDDLEPEPTTPLGRLLAFEARLQTEAFLEEFDAAREAQ